MDYSLYHCSKFPTSATGKKTPEKKSGLHWDSNWWPPRYRCDALPTELWKLIDLTPNVWLQFVNNTSFNTQDLVAPRVLVCQHDEVTKPISTVVVSCLKCTWMSAIVFSFHWDHEEPPGVDLRAVIVWLENWNESSTFALDFCGGFVAMGTF